MRFLLSGTLIIVASTVNFAQTTPAIFNNIYEVFNSKSIWNGGANSETRYIFSNSKPKIFEIRLDEQCKLQLPIHLLDDEIVISWIPEASSACDMNVNANFKISKFPVKGSTFAKMKLSSSKTLKTSYVYPEWVATFSKKNDDKKYKIFASTIYLGKPQKPEIAHEKSTLSGKSKKTQDSSNQLVIESELKHAKTKIEFLEQRLKDKDELINALKSSIKPSF